MKVKAAIATGQLQPLVVDEVDLDGPREGEVLIEIKSAGLCHTDQMLIDGSRDWPDYPLILGHEGAGIVREVGKGVTRLKEGDAVIPLAMPECGECPPCKSNKSNLCDLYFKPRDRKPFSWNGKPITSFINLGTFAQYVVVRDFHVAKIRQDAPLDQVCCMGCAGITGIGAALNTARVEAGSSVVVFGLGGIGLNVIDGARLAGATTIIGVDTNTDKEAPARKAGLTHFLNAKDFQGDDIVTTIHNLTNGGADYSFECVGHPALAQQAVNSSRMGWGTTVLIGIMPGAITDTMPIQPRSIQAGRWVTGSYLGNIKPISQFPELVDWYVEGKLTQDNLISHRFPIEQINEGFDLLKSGKAGRVVIDF
ncbi:alcohol dehydrogenase catalytic domain-containing protein [Celeribacter litoreus]|uniref:alcohol dehydrogenase catalytic domain-containing protein n=1 Tax=Celeribacter litoreus TaxID=2876714 RepID=UPI001CCE4481|nr:alcohol dehydrogenase catalytic domain-containing protein [Celeribacter litoreus]MCA0043381.1 alcohol dehydrogenase catalytic domain-containing protein [Celeribacter litoreus]